MPPIRPHRRQRDVRGGSRTAKAPLSLGADVSSAVSGLGSSFAEMDNVIRQQRAQDKSNRFKGLQRGYDDLRRGFVTEEMNLSGTDTYGSLERAESKNKEWLSQITKDIDDPELINALRSYGADESGRIKDRLAVHVATQRKSVSQGIMADNLDSTLRDSSDGYDLLENSLAKWQDTVAEQRELGLLGQDEATDLIKEGQNQIAASSLEGIIDRNPEAAIELIERGVYEDYMTPEQIKQFDKKAVALQKAIKADEEAARVEAERLVKVKQEEDREEANKGLTDLYSVGTLSMTAIEDNRDKLTAPEYQSWTDRQKRAVKDKKNATGKTVEDITIKRGLEVRAMEFGPETTASELEALRLDVADAVGKEVLAVETGRQIISDSVNSSKVSDTRKAQESGVIKLIDRDFEDGGVLDTLDSREVLDIKAFVLKESRDNPDKSVGEIYDQVLEPIKENRIVEWFGLIELPFTHEVEEVDPLRRIKELEFDPEKISAEIPESDVAIQILKDAGQPITEANIKYVLEQR